MARWLAAAGPLSVLERPSSRLATRARPKTNGLLPMSNAMTPTRLNAFFTV